VKRAPYLYKRALYHSLQKSPHFYQKSDEGSFAIGSSTFLEKEPHVSLKEPRILAKEPHISTKEVMRALLQEGPSKKGLLFNLDQEPLKRGLSKDP